MQVHYLELVTPDVDAVCAAHARLHGVRFGDPEPGLHPPLEIPGRGTFAIYQPVDKVRTGCYVQGGIQTGLWQV